MKAPSLLYRATPNKRIAGTKADEPHMSLSVYLPFFELRFLRSRRALRSLSSLIFVMVTLDGWIGIGTVWPLALSRVTRSTWITHFLRYTWMTLPSRSWKWITHFLRYTWMTLPS